MQQRRAYLDSCARLRTIPCPQVFLDQQCVEVDLEADGPCRQAEVLAHLRVQLTGMAQCLPVGEDELRGPTRMTERSSNGNPSSIASATTCLRSTATAQVLTRLVASLRKLYQSCRPSQGAGHNMRNPAAA